MSDAHTHPHSHGPSPGSDSRWLGIALALLLAFCGVEVVVGLLANSVALLSDAAHMVTDAGALALALVAARIARRPPRGGYTFGFQRAEVLSAQLNGILLLALAVVLGVEAIGRLAHPEDVQGGWVAAVGAAGLLVNLGAAWALARASRQSLNVHGARAHVLTDLYASGAAVLAGLIVLATGFDRADPILALVVVGLMLHSGVRLLAAAVRVLLEASPSGLHPGEIGTAMAASPGVLEVHDLHVWELTTGFPALAAHVLVAPGDDCHASRRALQGMLSERFGIEHTTLQVDHAPATGPLEIEAFAERRASEPR